MNADVVTEAVNRLRQQGQRISVRAVHQLTGGSFRDLARMLRERHDPPVDGDPPVARPMWLGATPVCPQCHTALRLADTPVPCPTCGQWVQQRRRSP
jgi:rubrerythrin